jgi:enamine deaminase RidA (YjgF/YER057c/UK114 family)
MDNFHRTFFEGMQMDICKTLTVGKLVFLSGTEAMDYEKGGAVAEDISEQIKVVVKKMNAALEEIGLSIGNMIKHTIYMKKGSADPVSVIQMFHQECYALAPSLKEKPSTGTLAVVDGLAVDTFKVEVDAIAAYPD